MKDVYDELRSLIQLDVDAVHAYEQAIKSIDDPEIRYRMEEYKEDHQRHIDDLSDYLIKEGQDVGEKTPDFKGFLIEGFTSLRSSTGTDGALKAMKSNEVLTNKKYEEASKMDLDLDAKNIVLRNYEDEKIHLAYIEGCIYSRKGVAMK